MLVAINPTTDRVVAGPEWGHETDCAERGYQCLFCGEQLTYTPAAGDTFDYFSHVSAPTCLPDAGSSKHHRAGQELISQYICNTLPLSPQAIAIAVEKHVGPPSGYRIADVLITHPIRLVIEVVYKTSAVHLRDRLQTAFRDGYRGLVAVLDTADVSAARIEHHLSAVGSIKVARLDPVQRSVTIGSVIRPATVTLAPDAWESVPAYIA
jgi:hypothetical protein